MFKFVLEVFCAVTFFGIFCNGAVYDDVLKNVYFQVFNNDTGKTWNSTWNATLESQGCSNTTNLTFIMHGWLEGLHKTLWIPYVIKNLLKLNGGCLIFYDYSVYAAGDYYVLVNSYYDPILQVLLNKLQQIANPSRMTFFGFSFGARLSMAAGANLTDANKNPLVPRMHLCEPAGPGFLGTTKIVNPKNASQWTSCINTSTGYGTYIYDCHQNFLMGQCGSWQNGQTSYPKGAHGLCPYFFNSSFTNDFTQNFNANCNPTTKINPPGIIMGPRNQVTTQGQVCMLTSTCYPYVVVNGTINNYPTGTYTCPDDKYMPVSNIFI